MIKITPKDAGTLDRALQKLVDDAEQATMGAVKGLVGYALAYIVPRTPQWSGELVSQWRVAAAETRYVPYKPRGFKDSEEAPWPIPENRDELDPYHAKRNPNTDALIEVQTQVMKDIERLVRNKSILKGATLWLPYLSNMMRIDGRTLFRSARRHSGEFTNALSKLDQHLFARYKRIDAGQALAMLKNPIPWRQALINQKRARTRAINKNKKLREEARVRRIEARAAEEYEAKRIRRAEKASAEGSQKVKIGEPNKPIASPSVFSLAGQLGQIAQTSNAAKKQRKPRK